MANWFRHHPQRSQNEGDTDVSDSKIDASKYADLLIREILTIIGRSVEAGKSIGEAMAAYNLNVENLETICYANDWIDEETALKYAEVKNNYILNNKIDISRPLDSVQEHRLYRKKFEFMLKEILSNQLKYMELEI